MQKKNNNDFQSMADVYNKIRDNHFNEWFSKEQLMKFFELQDGRKNGRSNYAIPESIINSLISDGVIRKKKTVSGDVSYFLQSGVNRDTFAKYYNTEKKTPVITEGRAIRFLKERGYQIYKPEGIDYEALLKEHPELQAQYAKFRQV